MIAPHTLRSLDEEKKRSTWMQCLRFQRHSLLAPRHRTLRLAELALSLAEELGGGDRRGGVAECGVVDQLDVDPDRFRGVGHRDRDVGHLELDDQGDVPLAVGPALERGALGLLGNVLALEGLDVADLGDDDSAVLGLDPLGDPEPSPVPLAALELRGSRPVLEEVREGAVQVLEDLVQRLRIRIVQPGRFRPAS